MSVLVNFAIFPTDKENGHPDKRNCTRIRERAPSCPGPKKCAQRYKWIFDAGDGASPYGILGGEGPSE